MGGFLWGLGQNRHFRTCGAHFLSRAVSLCHERLGRSARHGTRLRVSHTGIRIAKLGGVARYKFRARRETMRKLAAVLGVVGICVSCGGGSPTSPTPTPPPPPPTAPIVPACQQNNTAIVAFGNRSTSNTTQDVFWDGSRVATLTPGQDSEDRIVAAGVQHRIETRVTNGTRVLCTAQPVPAQCSNVIHTCSG